MKKPNILFIFSDQQRWDTLGCYGQKLDVTPNLDKLAQKGVRFENAFTCQPVCGPARACLQTGKYATETKNYRNLIALPETEKTIAHWLSENGYEVGYLGKWHLASTLGESEEDIGERFDCVTKPVPYNRRGGYKDYWLASDTLEFTSHGYDGYMYDKDNNKVEFKGYRADALTDFALDYLRSRTYEKPFFFFLSYVEPHHQNDHYQYEGPEGSKERFKEFEAPGDLIGLKIGDWREQYPDYLGCCASIDKNVGRLIRELESTGIADDTIIIYTSDHGSHFRTRCGEYKRSCHDASIRIPMIIYGGRFKGGKVINDLVSLIDLPPTLLDFAGIAKPDSMRGRSVQDLITGKGDEWPGEVFIQISEAEAGRAIRTKRWKYSVQAPDTIKNNKIMRRDMYEEKYLYDLEKDPHELINLAGDPRYEDIRNELCEILKRRMKGAGEDVPEIRHADNI